MNIPHINNSEAEIIKLKEELMSSNSNSDKKFASDCARQIINEGKGLILEENMRQILERELKWKQGDIPRDL